MLRRNMAGFDYLPRQIEKPCGCMRPRFDFVTICGLLKNTFHNGDYLALSLEIVLLLTL